MTPRTIRERIEELSTVYGVTDADRRAMLSMFASTSRNDVVDPAMRSHRLLALMMDAVMETRQLTARMTDDHLFAAMAACRFDEVTFAEKDGTLTVLATDDLFGPEAPGRTFRARAVSVDRRHRTVRQTLIDEGHRPATLMELLSFLRTYPRFPVCLTAQGTVSSVKGAPRVFIAHHCDAYGTFKLSMLPEQLWTPPWTRHLVVEYD